MTKLQLLFDGGAKSTYRTGIAHANGTTTVTRTSAATSRMDMHMEAIKVGIREFRSDLAEYIASSTPVAVTRHGQTVGYFIPTQSQVKADIAALKKANKTLDKLLEAQGVDVDSVVAHFKAARRRASVPAKN